jgi:cytochrome c biogenesis protein
VGTLVPQGLPAEAYADKFGKTFGPLTLSLGLDHLFTTWWYLLLLALLMVSAGACARRIWRIGRDIAAGPSLGLLQRKLHAGKAVGTSETVAGEAEAVEQRLNRTLGGHFYRVTAGADDAGGRWLVARKHGWAGWGIVLSHIAIFSIALGALLGIWPGLALDKMIKIDEGTVYQDKDGDFDFSLRLNSFSLEYYPGEDMVKAYKSDVSVIEGGREVEQQVILVNHPLTYKHVKFYQSSYGVGGFTVKVTPPSGAAEELSFPVQQMGGEEGPIYAIPEDQGVQFIAGRTAALVARGFSAEGPEDAPPDQPKVPAAQITIASGFGKGANHSLRIWAGFSRGSR